MDAKDYLIEVLKHQRNQALDALAQTIAAHEKERADSKKVDPSTDQNQNPT